MNYTKEL